MKVALIGATGNVGSKILAELLSRGHEVTGVARNTDKLTARPGLTAKRADATDEGDLSKAIVGHDAVISSLRFQSSNARTLINALKKAGVKRYLVVGGAGSLEVSPGLALIDTPEFPEAYKVEAGPGRDFLNVLREEKELEWTFLSPSAMFGPGERTGKFRLGKDQLLVDDKGDSRISQEDFAIAMVDELEKRQNIRQRFTVGY